MKEILIGLGLFLFVLALAIGIILLIRCVMAGPPRH
jgi:hypothetical protein